MLWGDNVALGRQCCSGEAMLLWGGNVALGREFALRRQFCYGEARLLFSCVLWFVFLWFLWFAIKKTIAIFY
ncbi:MAG TPA: hypothetical protein P5543_11765 [Planctomycetota bacterium]|nr:hypothetical protein [Planctomycetota bacterium]